MFLLHRYRANQKETKKHQQQAYKQTNEQTNEWTVSLLVKGVAGAPSVEKTNKKVSS